MNIREIGDEPNSKEANAPNVYSISLDEFQKQPPPEMLSYMNGQQVTRDTFASFLTQSFQRSRGSINAQLIELKWMDVNEGFDSYSLFQNYLKAGGFRCLSEVELEFILTAFRSAKVHAKMVIAEYGFEWDDQEILERMDEQISLLDPNDSLVPYEKLYGITREQLAKIMKQNIEEEKKKKHSYPPGPIVFLT